jgi:(2S)-methylsuccinyl-CoA dehydrogenase
MRLLNTELTTLVSQLGKLRLLFDRAVVALAARCTVDGKLSSPKLDECQVACFEIAWAGAELLAAETYVASDESSTALDKGLAALFAIDTVISTVPRLEVIYLQLGLPLEPLQQFISNAELTKLRQDITSSTTLSSLGQAVADIGGNVDFISLDGDEGMAQASFRRFGEEATVAAHQRVATTRS